MSWLITSMSLGVNDDESGIPPETFVHTYELLLTRLLDQYGAFVNHMIVLVRNRIFTFDT